MSKIDLSCKMKLILANESAASRQLALEVIEKPVPRVWMIFIPVIFVLYFWKLKEYENGLKIFAEHHLLPRQRILEAVSAAEESGSPVNTEQLVDLFGKMEEAKRTLCRKWLSVLIGHFRVLLTAEGDSYPQLVRSAYLNKTNYLLFSQHIGRAETEFNMTLLETIQGDSTDLLQVTDKMTKGMENLRRQEAEEIFS